MGSFRLQVLPRSTVCNSHLAQLSLFSIFLISQYRSACKPRIAIVGRQGMQNLPRWRNFDGGQALLCHLSYIFDARCHHDFLQNVLSTYFVPVPGPFPVARFRLRRSLWNLRRTNWHRHPNWSQASKKEHSGHTKRSSNMVFLESFQGFCVTTNNNRSLYIQSLIAMQQTPENELLSWFQVAGGSLSLSNAKL